jgi:hypothetical protein
MKGPTLGPALGEAAIMVGNLLGQSARLGLNVLGLVGSASNRLLCDAAQGRMPLKGLCGHDDCAIPPPCWEPRPLGQVTSYVAPGCKAVVRFRVTNCSFAARKIRFKNNKAASGIVFSPAELTLGPMESGTVSASIAVSSDIKQGEQQEHLIWIYGCNDYFLRWVIKVVPCGVEMCNEVEIEDCPDNIHHWYDHFYCHRPCFHDDRREHQ